MKVMYVVSCVRYSDETTVEESTPVAVSEDHTKARVYASTQAEAYAKDVGEVKERKLVGRSWEFYVLKPDPKIKTSAWVVQMVNVV